MAGCDAELPEREEHRHLLLSLKVTVEGLLANRAANIWSTYGGLPRLSNVVDKILSHKLLPKSSQDPTCYWNFILGLRVLMPTLAPNLERYNHKTHDSNVRKCQIWIQDSLRDHSLHLQLKLLLDIGQRSSVNLHYQDGSFLANEQYSQALLMCLKAVDKNDAAVLAEIDPNLLKKFPARTSRTRRSSLPGDSAVSRVKNAEDSETYLQTARSLSSRRFHLKFTYSPELMHDSDSNVGLKEEKTVDKEPEETCVGATDHRLASPSHRRTKSDTSIVTKMDIAALTVHQEPTTSGLQSRKSEFYVGTEQLPGILHIDYNGEHSMESSVSGSDFANAQMPSSGARSTDGPREMSTQRNISHVRSMSDIIFSSKTTLPMPRSSSTIMGMQTDPETLMQDANVSAIQPSRSSIFRRPMQGQSLTSFLSSQDFRTCAELDKENAHFSISEALIAAIEQIKCNQILKEADEEVQESDDEEIKHLKQRIRIRRRERLQQREFPHAAQLLSDGKTDTNNSATPSPASSMSSDRSGYQSSDVEHLDTCLSDECETESKLTTLQESGLSLSMASLYSDADIHRPGSNLQSNVRASDGRNSTTDSTVSYISAESVALSLLKRFSEKQLPKASDLDWLVSEQDAPQRLLPLPTSWPISPDEAENNLQANTRIRGNLEWAPPRPQIIFNIHPISQRNVILAKQNNRCAGCGTKVEKGFVRRYRYCEYLGKLFCQCCHNNNSAIIPGYVLRKWDFTKYPVSNYARDLLDNIQMDPLYDINDINHSLYRRVRVLGLVLNYRQQLFHLKDFVRSCRHAEKFQLELDKLPAYLYTNPHVYSLNDLIMVKMGELVSRLKNLVTHTLTHITSCPLCQARGFVCELCKDDRDIIYSFQLSKSVQCPQCWACYHRSCFEPSKCPKCARIEARKIYEKQFPDASSTDDEV